MQIRRPHIIARKTLLPAFRFRRILLTLILLLSTAFVALFGNDLFANLPLPEGSVLILTVVLGVATLIPIFVILGHIVILNSRRVEFYDTYVIKKSGVFHKVEEKCMFPKVLSCHVSRSFAGRIFNYGDVKVDAIGKWDVDLTNVRRPLFIRKYLENHFISAKEIRAMRQTVVTQ